MGDKKIEALSKFELKNSLFSVSIQISFQTIQRLFIYFEGLKRIVNIEITSESKRLFDVAGLREN